MVSSTQYTNEPLDDQAHLVNEINRAKALTQKHAERQHELGLQKLNLEEKIMAKAELGEDHSLEWAELQEARTEIDCLAEEKLLILKKIYNLSQRFVQEIDESIDETKMIMTKQPTQSRNSLDTNYMKAVL